MKSIPYASTVRSLMYTQVCTHPNIAFITGLLGRFQTNPRLKHWEAIKKALRYVQGTKNLMLTYRKSDELKFVGYAHADFAGGYSRKSMPGYIFTLAGGAISWKSSKQMVKTTNLPLMWGNLSIKSMVMSAQTVVGTSSGCSNLAGWRCSVLFAFWSLVRWWGRPFRSELPLFLLVPGAMDTVLPCGIHHILIFGIGAAKSLPAKSKCA
jgi:hypothetical protein